MNCLQARELGAIQDQMAVAADIRVWRSSGLQRCIAFDVVIDASSEQYTLFPKLRLICRNWMVDNQHSLPALSSSQLTKLRLLTLVDMAGKHQSLSYGRFGL